jgi:hypothetical protein
MASLKKSHIDGLTCGLVTGDIEDFCNIKGTASNAHQNSIFASQQLLVVIIHVDQPVFSVMYSSFMPLKHAAGFHYLRAIHSKFPAKRYQIQMATCGYLRLNITGDSTVRWSVKVQKVISIQTP